MVASTKNGERIAALCERPEPPIEVIDGHIVRARVGPWLNLDLEALQDGMTQREVTLACNGGTLRFYVYLELIGEYVYAWVAGSRWLNRSHRHNDYTIDRDLQVKAEKLSLYMI